MPEVNDPQAQPNATADAPQLPTTSMPAGQLQEPAAAAPAQAAPAMVPSVQPVAPPVTATSPNKHLMAFGARLLGAIAGDPEPSYSYDANGKQVVTPAPPLTSGQKVQRILGHALTGLAAPVDKDQKSGLAKGLSGLGAGAEAVKEQQMKQDVLKRSQAKENFEQEQQTKLRHMEIGKQNALTASIYYENLKRANDLDPHFAGNQSLYDAVKASPELGAHATEMSDKMLEEAEKADPMFTQTHILKPLGWAPATDEKGNPILDAEGQPTKYMRIGVINGTKDGKIAVTPQVADDFKKYGGMARVAGIDNIKAGDTYDLQSLIPAMNKIDEQKKTVLEGWQKSELGWAPDPKDPKKQIPVEINKMMPPDMEGRVRPLTATPVSLASEEGKTKLENAQAFEAQSKGREALANAAAIAGGAITNDGDFAKSAMPDYMAAVKEVQQTNPAGYAILRNVPPIYQKAVLLVANGDATIDDATKNPRKGVPVITPIQMESYASILNPKWTKQMYQAKKDAAEDMIRKNGDSIKAFGQFGVHVGDLKEVSDRFQRTQSPWLNKSINEIKSQGLGQAGVPGMMAAVDAVRHEWLNVINSGHASDLQSTNEAKIIMSDASNPAQILDAAKVMGSQVIGRLDQVDNIWRRTWGGHYPGILSDSARAGFESIGLGDAVKPYPRESGPMFGAREGGYGQPNGSQSGQPQLTNLHSDGKTTIGWDGKQWVDQSTNKPYVAPQGQQ